MRLYSMAQRRLCAPKNFSTMRSGGDVYENEGGKAEVRNDDKNQYVKRKKEIRV